MGGHAFASEGFITPRMPTKVYQKVLAQVQSQLRPIYARVETPIEGPAKIDHGDIDVVVVAKDGETAPSLKTISDALNAESYMQTTNSHTSHFVIPWPKDEPAPENSTNDVSTNAGGQLQPSKIRLAIQVDVFLCPSIQDLNYTIFHKAHGDMWTMLGAVIRRFGFTGSTSGFYFRIPGLETYNKRVARLKLTDDPETVLRYLNLDIESYWTKFSTWEEHMGYVATCRFHDPKRGQQYDDQDVKEKYDVVIAHDRSKIKQRPMLRYWFEVYLKNHRDAVAGSACHMTREETMEDVKKFFGESIAKELDERRRTGMKALSLQKLWSEVRQSLSCTGSDLTYAMKGLKFEISTEKVMKDEDRLVGVRKAFQEERYDDVKQWVSENWEDVKVRQEQRDREQSTAKLLEHLEKENTKAAEKVVDVENSEQKLEA